MADRFDPQALEDRYAFIDAVPEALLPSVLNQAGGALSERVRGIVAWRDSLLAGRVPDPSGAPWPDAVVATPLCEVLTALGIARFCEGEPTVVDALLADLLTHIDAARSAFAQAAGERLAHLEAEARAALEAQITTQRQRASNKSRRQRRNARFGLSTIENGRIVVRGHVEPDSNIVVLRPGTVKALEREAERAAGAAAISWFESRLRPSWAPRVEIWSRLAEVFGELGEHLGLGWNLSHGVLRHHGWIEMSRLHELVSQLEPLRALVQTLGRLQASTHEEHSIEQIFVTLRRTEEELHRIETPLAPTETRGIERTDHIDRMLPSEAALLTHPLLRRVWHARRAERALLAYHREGHTWERVDVEVEQQVEESRRRPRPERGPIIVCLDTSGSMAGLPEQVSKAITLEAVRRAAEEKRLCHLYAFSGPGDLRARTISLDPAGLVALLDFLTSSFHGGTDVHTPLDAALDQLSREEWTRADVLLVSDGQFGVSSALVARVTQARERRGTRFHGLLIGQSRHAMERVCDPLHVFADWQSALGDRPAANVMVLTR